MLRWLRRRLGIVSPSASLVDDYVRPTFGKAADEIARNMQQAARSASAMTAWHSHSSSMRCDSRCPAHEPPAAPRQLEMTYVDGGERAKLIELLHCSLHAQGYWRFDSSTPSLADADELWAGVERQMRLRHESPTGPERAADLGRVTCSACLAGVAHTFGPSAGMADVHLTQAAFDVYAAGMDAQRRQQDVDWPIVRDVIWHMRTGEMDAEQAWQLLQQALGREARRVR